VQRRFSILLARAYAQHSVILQTDRVALDSGKPNTLHVVSVLAPAATNNSTQMDCPLAEAWWSGVPPLMQRRSSLARMRIKRDSFRISPLLAAEHTESLVEATFMGIPTDCGQEEHCCPISYNDVQVFSGG
jgi:hypothetical protein